MKRTLIGLLALVLALGAMADAAGRDRKKSEMSPERMKEMLAKRTKRIPGSIRMFSRRIAKLEQTLAKAEGEQKERLQRVVDTLKSMIEKGQGALKAAEAGEAKQAMQLLHEYYQIQRSARGDLRLVELQEQIDKLKAVAKANPEAAEKIGGFISLCEKRMELVKQLTGVEAQINAAEKEVRKYSRKRPERKKERKGGKGRKARRKKDKDKGDEAVIE